MTLYCGRDSQDPFLDAPYDPYGTPNISSDTLAQSENPTKDGQILVDYRNVTNRTPSPTQSEAKVLSDKTRSCNCKEMKKVFDPEWLKQPRKMYTYSLSTLPSDVSC